MKKLLFLLSLTTLLGSSFSYSSSVPNSIITSVTVHLHYLTYLQHKIDTVLEETPSKSRDLKVQDLLNEISGIITALESEGNLSYLDGLSTLSDETLFVYIVLKGLQTKLLNTKRSIELE